MLRPAKKNALPNAEEEFSGLDGDRQARRRERGFDVGGHIIGPFLSMRIDRVVFGYQPFEPGFEVTARRGICIFLDQQTCGSVLNEERAKTFIDRRFGDVSSGFFGEFEESRTRWTQANARDQALVAFRVWPPRALA